MAGHDDVRLIARALPKAVESTDQLGFSVGGKAFVWLWRERVHPKKAKVPNPDVIVVRVADLGEKEAVLASYPRMCFTEPHYDGYKAVLVRLSDADPEVLRELVTDSWRCVAPADLHDQLE